MSFLPWLTNFMHTFVWIGVCLSYLYLGVGEHREDAPDTAAPAKKSKA